MTSSFHHPKDSQCPLVIRQDSLFKNLGDEYIDESQAKKMRGDFFQEHTIKRAFAFISTLCGYGVLNAEKLKACLRIADAMNIWAYRNIEQWMLPYMLITLRDFEVPGRKYSWRFVLQKERGCPKPFWLHHDKCSLLKVDSTSGNSLPASDNPLPFSENRYNEKSSNADWIYPELIRSIMAIC